MQKVLNDLVGVAVIHRVEIVEVGEYRAKQSGNYMGRALQIHWHVAVVNVRTSKVVAITHLVGSPPPDELEVGHGGPLDYKGDPPSIDSLRLWLESLERN